MTKKVTSTLALQGVHCARTGDLHDLYALSIHNIYEFYDLALTIILVSRRERNNHAAVVIDNEEGIIIVGGFGSRRTGEFVKSKLVFLM